MLSIPVKNFNFLGIHPKTVLLWLRGCVSVSISEKNGGAFHIPNTTSCGILRVVRFTS